MALVAGLALVCLALVAALALSGVGTAVAYGTAGTAEPSTALVGGGAPRGPAAPTAAAPEASGAAGSESVSVDSLLGAFPAEPDPIPTATITRLEDAGEEPLETEMAHLLDAIQLGFGEGSAQIAPSLRPYLFRIAGRLSVRTETFRIAATAPEPALARARAATLRRLLDVAGVTDSRLSIAAGEGPHALTLVSG